MNRGNSGLHFGVVRKATKRDLLPIIIICTIIGLAFIGFGIFGFISIDDVARFILLVLVLVGLFPLGYAIKQIKTYFIDDVPFEKYVIKGRNRTTIVNGNAVGYPTRFKDLTPAQEAELEANKKLTSTSWGLIFFVSLLLGLVGSYFVTFYVVVPTLQENGTLTEIYPAAYMYYGFVAVALTVLVFSILRKINKAKNVVQYGANKFKNR